MPKKKGDANKPVAGHEIKNTKLRRTRKNAGVGGERGGGRIQFKQETRAINTRSMYK